MGTPAAPIAPRQVGILILDDDVQSQGALKQILDSEGWRVRVVPDTKLFLAELRTGEWSLVIVNVTITGTDSPLFVTLRELTNVSPEEGGRLRALYMVPDRHAPSRLKFRQRSHQRRRYWRQLRFTLRRSELVSERE